MKNVVESWVYYTHWQNIMMQWQAYMSSLKLLNSGMWGFRSLVMGCGNWKCYTGLTYVVVNCDTGWITATQSCAARRLHIWTSFSALRTPLHESRLDAPTTQLWSLPTYNWLPVKYRIQYKVAVIVYKPNRAYHRWSVTDPAIAILHLENDALWVNNCIIIIIIIIIQAVMQHILSCNNDNNTRARSKHVKYTLVGHKNRQWFIEAGSKPV